MSLVCPTRRLQRVYKRSTHTQTDGWQEKLARPAPQFGCWTSLLSIRFHGLGPKSGPCYGNHVPRLPELTASVTHTTAYKPDWVVINEFAAMGGALVDPLGYIKQNAVE